jgi:hypothetical protein
MKFLYFLPLLACAAQAANFSTIQAPLQNTGVDADAAGRLVATLKLKESELRVRAENLTPGANYDLEFGGVVEASVVAKANGKFNVRFRSPQQSGTQPLDFDPRGQTLRVLTGGQSVLEAVISGTGEATGSVVQERANLLPVDPTTVGKAKAAFDAKANGRKIFRVEVAGVASAGFEVFVAGTKRGDLPVTGGAGRLVFASAGSDPNTLPLDFDPRGAVIDLVAGGVIVFSGDMAAKCDGVNQSTPKLGKVTIPSTGTDPDGRASARLRIDRRARKHFSVEVEAVPVGAYDLLVNGAPVGTINVAQVAAGTKGEIEFSSSDDDGDELPLTFDPTGKTLTVLQGAVKFFEGLFDPNLGGGAPSPEPPSQLEENLTSTGLDPDASGDAKYRVDQRGRHKFSVEIEDVPAGFYNLVVGGTLRGSIRVVAAAGRVEGEIEFSTSDDNGDELPLTFDPRGQLLEITRAGGIYFSHLFGNGSGGSGGAIPFRLEVPLLSTGADANASAKAELKQKASGQQSFEVEVEDVNIGAYDLLVGGTVRGTINVVAVDGGTRGQIEFESEPDSGELLLNFPVAGQEIIVQQGATVFFRRIFPNP